MPQTKNAVFRIIAENSSRVTALNNGEVDMIDGIDAPWSTRSPRPATSCSTRTA